MGMINLCRCSTQRLNVITTQYNNVIISLTYLPLNTFETASVAELTLSFL